MSSGLLVYVVDDDEAVRESTLALLESADIAGRGYATAADFLADFDADSAGCIILDVHMPLMSGLELLTMLRARGVTTPVIVVSGRGDAALDEIAKRAGATALLNKPVNDEEFLDLVRAALSRPRLV